MTTYVEDQNTLEICVKLGYDKVLIEESHFSLLSQKDWTEKIDYEHIDSLFEIGKALNPKLEIVFNLDLMAHDQDLKEVKVLIDHLQRTNYDGIRVQDIGLASLIKDVAPEVHLEVHTVTGNYNGQAISFLEKALKPSIRSIVFSKEIPYKELKDINDKSTLNNEILVHGPILLFYSKRRLIHESDFAEESHVGTERYGLFLQEKKRPDEYFRFLDNSHGSFMFHSEILCLIRHIPEILALDMAYILFDFRGQEMAVIRDVTHGFKTQLRKHDSYSGWDDGDEEIVTKMQNHYPQKLSDGFFLENLTDSHVKGKESGSAQRVAKVLGVVKERVMALEVLIPITTQADYTIKTPDGKSFSYSPRWIERLDGINITRALVGSIVIVNWRKGVSTGSSIHQETT
ncbi:MAG: hypothetical protein IEMM0008_0678 [bacterium]|nr:MAG: hypothetical protein IEMM0008_0678 [bacterium]